MDFLKKFNKVVFLFSAGIFLATLIFLIFSSERPETILATTRLNNILGEQRTLVILFNFINDTSQPMTKAEVESIMFTAPDSVDNYYRENSYSKIYFSGRVVGYYTIPDSYGDCNYDTWSNEADSLAAADGVDISTFQRIIYIFPFDDTCPSTAWTDQGGIPSRTWFTGVIHPTSDVFAHELGHNFGLGHGNSLNCGTTVISGGELYSSGCNIYDYGDFTDIMGDSIIPMPHFSAPHKMVVGWLEQQQIQTVNQSGTFTVSPLEIVDSNIKMLKIPLFNNAYPYEYYYLSYRQPVGFDVGLSSGVYGGAQIHIFDESDPHNPTLLLNAIPTGSPGSSLQDNVSVIDTVNGITITQLSHNQNQVTLQINFNPVICRRNIPSLQVVPPSQSGFTGQTLAYNLSVTNHDESVCAPASFQIYLSSGESWTFLVTPQELTLNPGQSGTAMIQVTSPVSSSNGEYDINILNQSKINRHAVSTIVKYLIGNTTPTPPPCTKTGDVNCDGAVNMIDIGIVINNYNSTPPSTANADLNGDGKVDIADIGIVLGKYRL